ncbi:MAG TPA: malto-oligosyltrehalose trehalohydrolase [Burkholderiales bacterium]
MATAEIAAKPAFGAQLTPHGVRFALWAPSASSVELVLQEDEKPMKRTADGWFELLEPEAAAGTLYQYRIDGELLVPDPASRFQPRDVDGPSEVIDPAFDWDDWKGRPWEEAVIYELHVGCFSNEGDYGGVEKRLSHLKSTGITAIELMPLADFSGKRNWGYDGVLPYAPDSAYGRPEELKRLVRAAHRAGLMVFLDVIYNHFGPKGNYLQRYAPQFFTERHRTPWGAAIDFSNPWVRQYFVQNALYWLREYRFDGLRFDAVHAIVDESPKHVLEEIAFQIKDNFSKERQIHLVLENDANQARYLKTYTAQWNDDSHHAFHVLATGEAQGYYKAYVDAPARHLARCLAEGFAYQGEVSPFSGERRGERSADLPPTAFVDFLQNHDQIGNRAFGDRIISLTTERRLKTLTAILLLAPSIPLLFMGEEWGCRQPFQFFCDFPGELGEAVRQGRRREFADIRDMPDPTAEETFRRCVLRWEDVDQGWLGFYRNLLFVRKKEITPRKCGPGRYRMFGDRAFEVRWGALRLVANCGEDLSEKIELPVGAPFFSIGEPAAPWSAAWWIE